MASFTWTEMTKKVVTISPGANLGDAIATMRSGLFRHLPVVDGRELVGIISDRDLLRHHGEESRRVAEVMSRPVSTCGLNSRIGDVADVMLSLGIDALPVVNEDGSLAGIVTSTDLLKFLRRSHSTRREEPFERLIVDLNDLGDCED